MIFFWTIPINRLLFIWFGGFNPSEKYYIVIWDDYSIPNKNGKNKKNGPVTTNQVMVTLMENPRKTMVQNLPSYLGTSFGSPGLGDQIHHTQGKGVLGPGNASYHGPGKGMYLYI